jgi:hypothetical protein
MVLVNAGKQEMAARLHARTRWLIPALWIASMAFVFIANLIIPYHRMLASM